jgi:LuxR family maltose regulon positive regulatory protein
MNRSGPSFSSQAGTPFQGNILRRARLSDRLDEALGLPLTLVIAPAGFGKTVLLSSHLEESTRPVAWLSLRDWHREPREFFEAFARAIEANVTTEAETGAAGLRRELRRLLWNAAQTGDDAVIVLDDFQTIDGSEACSLVEDLLESAPSVWRIVISSRRIPRLRGVTRLMTSGRGRHISAEELRFGPDEAAALLAETGTGGPDVGAGQALVERTGGWPIEVALSRLDVSGSPELQPGDSLFLEDLIEETLSALTPELRDFLADASVMPLLEASLCDEVMDRSDSATQLKQAAEAAAFLLFGQGGRFEMLPAARSHLKEKLKGADAARFTALSRRAGKGFAGREAWDDAVPLLLEAGLWTEAAALIAAAADALLSYGKAGLLRAWTDQLPASLLAEQPELQVLRARIRVDLDELDSALEILAGVLDSDCGPLVRGTAHLYRTACLSRKGQHQEAIRSGRAAVSLLSANNAPRRLQAEAHLRLGNAIGASGQFARSVPSLRKALSLADDIGAVQTASVAADDLGVAHGNLGRIPSAQVYLERARAGWASLGNQYRLVLTLNNLGVMYQLQGEYERSAEILTEAIEVSRASANARIEAFATLSLADVRRDTGRYKEAIDLYSDGLEKARRLGESYFVDYAVDAMGMTYMLMGDLDTAEQLIKRTAAEVSERGGTFEIGLASLSLGILAHLRADFAGSEARLGTALKVFKEAGAAREEARAHFHLAHVHLATNSRRKALASLEEVVRLVDEIGYGAFLAADSRRCPALTAFAASKRLGNGVFARLREDQARRVLASELGILPSYPRIEAFALGDARVTIDGRLITEADWASVKSKEMFLFFLTRQKPCSRDEVCAALWPDFDGTRATSNFHSTLYRLRSATYFDVVTASNGRYRLNPSGTFEFDVHRFEAAVAQAESSSASPAARITAAEAAVEVYDGQFAAEIFSEWADGLRTRLEEKYLRALGTLALNASATADFERCLGYADKILAVDETNDEAHCLKVESLSALGDRVSAVRHFESYRRLMGARGGPPSERLVSLARRLAAALN